MTKKNNVHVSDLDKFWKQAVKDGTAPESIKFKEARLQQLSSGIMEVEDELRDWAKKEMDKNDEA